MAEQDFRLRDTSGWQVERGEGKVTAHSLVVGGILCRWWGEIEPPGAPALVDLFCYEDELPCPLTPELFAASILDGVRLYPWKAVVAALRERLDDIAAQAFLCLDLGIVTLGEIRHIYDRASLPPKFDGAGQSDCCAEEKKD